MWRSLRCAASPARCMPRRTGSWRQYSICSRCARVDGAWKPVDNTLAKHANGSVAPAAAGVGLEFSGGGNGPLVTLDRAGRKLAFTWPTSLPVPVLDGNSALYKDVLPDVDLKLSSDTDGFSELLVVNTAEAAKNPELAELKLKIDSSGLDLRTTGEGGLEAVDETAGGVVFQAPKPIMWDSGQADEKATTTLAARDTRATTDGTHGPGDSSNVAPIGMAISSDGSRIEPDSRSRHVDRSGHDVPGVHRSADLYPQSGGMDDGLAVLGFLASMAFQR